jgi:cell shape-determining protein MreC
MLRSRILVFAATFSLLFIIGQIFFVPKQYASSALLSAFAAPRIFFDALRNKQKLIAELKDLVIENQSLRGQIGELQATPGIISQGKINYLRAPVYSTYPLTSARSLIIGAGEKEGVMVGETVEVKPGLFIGIVGKVFEHQSQVQTVFDNMQTATTTAWQLPVKIGSASTDALLVTGIEPKITIISRKKGVLSGDSVVLASKDYPYGISVGTVGSIIDDPTSVFLEARLAVPYSVSELSEVFVRLPKNGR